MKFNNFAQTITSIAVATTLTFSITNKAEAEVLGGALTGNYNVGKTSYHLVDSSRKEIYTPDSKDYRELMVQVLYPTKNPARPTPSRYIDSDAVVKQIEESTGITGVAALFKSVENHTIPKASIAGNKSNYPVLLFSHGLDEIPEFYTSIAEQLASHGYIVVSISHSYDALATAFLNGKIATKKSNQILSQLGNPQLNFAKQKEISAQAIQIRAADAQFVLNELYKLNTNDPQNLLKGKLDLSKVGILGHSMGGAAAAETMRLDSRFKAGINMDGTLWTDVIKSGLNKPFMLMNAANSFQQDSDMKTFYKNLKSDKYHLTIKNSLHQNFSDKPLLAQQYSLPRDLLGVGKIDPNLNSRIINDYTLGFFNKYLTDKTTPLLNTKVNNKDINFTY